MEFASVLPDGLGLTVLSLLVPPNAPKEHVEFPTVVKEHAHVTQDTHVLTMFVKIASLTVQPDPYVVQMIIVEVSALCKRAQHQSCAYQEHV